MEVQPWRRTWDQHPLFDWRVMQFAGLAPGLWVLRLFVRHGDGGTGGGGSKKEEEKQKGELPNTTTSAASFSFPFLPLAELEVEIFRGPEALRFEDLERVFEIGHFH